MDNPIYEGWFVTSLKEDKKEEEKLEEGEIVTEQENNPINLINNEIKDESKNFLGNKRVNKDPLEEERKNEEIENDNKAEKEEKPTGIINKEIENINNGETFDTENKIITENDLIEDNEGKITFKSFNNNTNKKYLKEYVYLRTQNDFVLNEEKKEYRWKIRFIKFAKKINLLE